MAQSLGLQASGNIAAVSGLGAGGYNFFFDTIMELVPDGSYRPVPFFGINGYNDQIECWGLKCLFAYPLWVYYHQVHPHVGGSSGWRNWARMNGCQGGSKVISRSSDHSDHKWISEYDNCRDGVEVRQLLNSRNHAGEWIFGTNGLDTQFEYMERVLEFLFRWSL
jgi:poly(3-hydroxybutyrate) depolymerase